MPEKGSRGRFGFKFEYIIILITSKTKREYTQRSPKPNAQLELRTGVGAGALTQPELPLLPPPLRLQTNDTHVVDNTGRRRFPPKHDPPDCLEVRGVGSDAVYSAGLPSTGASWSRSLTTSPPITTLRVEGRRRRWAHDGQVRCGKCGPGLMLSSPP